MSKFIDKIGKALGMSLRPGKWDEYYNLLYREGKPDSKQFKRMLFILCEAVEELEEKANSISIPSVFGKTSTTTSTLTVDGTADDAPLYIAKKYRFDGQPRPKLQKPKRK